MYGGQSRGGTSDLQVFKGYKHKLMEPAQKTIAIVATSVHCQTPLLQNTV